MREGKTQGTLEIDVIVFLLKIYTVCIQVKLYIFILYHYFKNPFVFR